MTRISILAVVGLLLFAEASLAQPATQPSTQPVVRCAVINGMNVIGFWKAVSEKFESDTGIKVETITFGEKAVVDRSFRDGGIDLITMHASDKIINLVADGLASDPQPWVHNDLVIVGPADDPAGIKGMSDACEAIQKIASAKAPFVVHSSLGAQGVLRAIAEDAQAEFDQKQLTMLFDDRGRDVLKIAAEKRAYTLIGRIPFRTGRIPNAGLELMVQGDPRLRRPYVVAVANPERAKGARVELARRLAAYLRAPSTQAWIADWGRGRLDDHPVFVAIAVDTLAKLPADVVLPVAGDVPAPINLTTADWSKLPRVDIDTASKDGTKVSYSGVRLRDVLKSAGVALGNHQLRGRRANQTVHVHASDGYIAAFALGELDDELAEHNIIVADQKDGQPLPATEGPLRLVAPDEKRPARWVRMVTTVQVR